MFGRAKSLLSNKKTSAPETLDDFQTKVNDALRDLKLANETLSNAQVRLSGKESSAQVVEHGIQGEAPLHKTKTSAPETLDDLRIKLKEAIIDLRLANEALSNATENEKLKCRELASAREVEQGIPVEAPLHQKMMEKKKTTIAESALLGATYKLSVADLNRFEATRAKEEAEVSYFRAEAEAAIGRGDLVASQEAKEKSNERKVDLETTERGIVTATAAVVAARTAISNLKAAIGTETLSDSDIISFIAESRKWSIDFVKSNTDTDYAATLGPLHKPGIQWPIAHRRVDMRLLSRKELSVGEPVGAPPDVEATTLQNKFGDKLLLRPVCYKLDESICKHPGIGKAFGLVAVPASGKTSAVIDLGHLHFVVLVQATAPPSTNPVERRISRDFDESFTLLVQNIRQRTSGLGPNVSKDDQCWAWRVAEQRCLVEIVARLLDLHRLRLHVEIKEQRVLEPWDYMQHQICSSRTFLKHAVEELLSWSVVSLTALAGMLVETIRSIRYESAELKPELVIALDETDYARDCFKGLFRNPDSRDAPGDVENTGLLSPLASSAGILLRGFGIHVILAGTGASRSKVESTQISIGKNKSSLDIQIFMQDSFPKVTWDDVKALLSRLGLVASDFLPPAENAKRSPVLLSSKEDRANMPMSEFVATYVVGARFRVLFGAVEKVLDILPLSAGLDGKAIFELALRGSVEHHINTLCELFQKRLGPNERGAVKVPTLVYMEKLLVSASLTNGKAEFIQSPKSGLILLEGDSQIDLTEIGIASVSQLKLNENKEQVWSVSITEAFVLDAMHEYMTLEAVRVSFKGAMLENSVKWLRSTMAEFGATSQHEGNLVELAMLKSLATWGSLGMLVSDVPFLKPFLGDRAKDWSDYRFFGQYFVSGKDGSTIKLLLGPKARQCVVWADDQCRPDGVALLTGTTPTADESPRALTFACAVYSGKVFKAKMISQMHATDLSRAYLSVEGNVYRSARAQREAWVDAGLDKVRAIRVCVALPFGEKISIPGTSGDILATLDCTNIHLLLGKPGAGEKDMTLRNFYALLKIATNSESVKWGYETL